jgi:hypothetical protein
MSGTTEAGKDAVDELAVTVGRIELEAFERIEDIVGAAARYEWREEQMDRAPNGEYLDRDEVMAAIARVIRR